MALTPFQVAPLAPPPQLSSAGIAEVVRGHLRNSQSPTYEAFQTLRKIREQAEGEIALAYSQAMQASEHLTRISAPPVAHDNLAARTQHFEVYATQLADITSKKILGLMQAAPLEQMPQTLSPGEALLAELKALLRGYP